MREYDELKKELKNNVGNNKIGQKKIFFYAERFKEKLGKDLIIYSPKILVDKFKK